jgi:hypothetical protein
MMLLGLNLIIETITLPILHTMRFRIQSPLGENNLCLHCTPVPEKKMPHTLKARASLDICRECIKVKQFILDFVSYSARPA